MKRIKYIIIIVIINILIMSTYINISYGVNYDETVWDNNRDGVLDETERAYAKQGITIMMPELDLNQDSWVSDEELNFARQRTGKSNFNAIQMNNFFRTNRESSAQERYEGYEGKEVTKLRTTLQKGVTLYFGSEKPNKRDGFELKEPSKLYDFEDYIDTVKDVAFSGWFEKKQQFYKIPIEDFFNSYEEHNGQTKEKMMTMLYNNDVASSGSGAHVSVDEYHGRDYVYIKVSDIGTKEDIKDYDYANEDRDIKIVRFTLSVPSEILNAEKVIYRWQGLNRNAFINTNSVHQAYKDVVQCLDNLNKLEERSNISNKEEDQEKDIKKYGYSGWRVYKDKKDLTNLKDYLKVILVNIKHVASFENGQLVLNPIIKQETGEIIVDEKVTDDVTMEEGKTESDSEDEILDKYKYYGPMHEPEREGYVHDNQKTGLEAIFSSGESFLKNGTVMGTAGLTDFSNTLFSILFIAGIAITVLAGLVIGIKFILGSVEEKAEIKKYLWPYLIGCIVIYGGFAIWKLVVTILQQI